MTWGSTPLAGSIDGGKVTMVEKFPLASPIIMMEEYT